MPSTFNVHCTQYTQLLRHHLAWTSQAHIDPETSRKLSSTCEGQPQIPGEGRKLSKVILILFIFFVILTVLII